MNKIKTLLIDIGGVILTNGWDHEGRVLAAKTFDLDLEEMEKRHRLVFDTYEIGKMTLEEYIDHIVFYKKRPFTNKTFEKFMYQRSKPYKDMLQLFPLLKEKYNLRIGALSNEGRELTLHRIKTFKLDAFIDFFTSSCFVHLRKPDKEIYHLALDLAQTPLKNTLYIDDRPLFVTIGKSVGIPSLQHKDYDSTKNELAKRGLKL